MEKTEEKAPRKRRKSTSCFTGCFGFSEEHTSLKSKPRPDSEYKNVRWLSYWSRFRKKSAAKTVPVDGSPTTASAAADVEREKVEARRRYHETVTKKPSSKQKTKRKSKKLQLSSTPPRDHKPPPPTVAASDRDPAARILETLMEAAADQDPAPDRTEPATVRTSLSNQISFSRKIDAIRSSAGGSSSQPGSPLNRIRTARPTAISPSASFPALLQETIRVPKKPPSKGGAASKTLDPVVGMSVIMVTLVIMILWGRFCAILCTAAWLYFIPQLRSTTGPAERPDPDPVQPDLDLESEEYKKKVVLEGLLERNRRSSS